MDDVKENSIVDLKKFFEADGRHVSIEEFSEFWKSLTEEEKDEYRRAQIEKLI